MKRGINIFVSLATAIAMASVLPLSVHAQLPSSPGPAAGMTGVGFMPTVPVSNPAIEAKETGINILGVRIPISWDSLAIQIAKKTIERMVDSTVEWINTGFDGNPAYVTDPGQYFTDLADGIGGEFIMGSTTLDFLCSPFRANIKLSLVQNFQKADPFQCTISEIGDNIEGFYNDFVGGWDSWLTITQNSGNNPYSAYLEAKIELDSEMQRALKIEEDKLAWSGGFLSWAPCIVPDPLTGECLKRGPVETPGIVIEGLLEETLGTGVRQLELADEFDELIGALMGQLLEKTVFSAQGLFKTSHKVASTGTNSNFPNQPPAESSCPIPDTPRSLCENVDRGVVLGIVNKYRPSNAGIRLAIQEINTIYPEARILSHPVRLDKIDFGGGLVIDIIEAAVGGSDDAEGRGWTWGVDCECGGSSQPELPPGTEPSV